MKLLFIFALVFIGNYSQAYVVDNAKKGDTLETVAKRNIENVQTKYGSRIKDYEEDIKKWNPFISDWNHLSKNQKIYVDYPYDYYVSGSTWTPQLGIEDEDEYNRQFSLGIFYASSFGSYSEATTDQTVKSDQNFPVTLGIASTSSTDEKKHFLIASLYWAKAAKAKVSGNSGSATTDFSIPGEVGGNLYYQYYFKENKFGLYSGYDFEKLNTFNTDSMINGSALENVDNKIHYLTGGVTKGFTLFDFNMNVKASYSKTIASSTTGSKSLSGSKFILFYTYKPDGPFSLSAFYKHHSLLALQIYQLTE